MASFSFDQQPHFVLFPFMAQGHLIPMVDIGRLLARQNVIVTIITTPHNAGRVQNTVAGAAAESGYPIPIRLLQVQFPCKQVGLPEGCENTDMVSSKEDIHKIFTAANMMEEAVVELFETLTPRPHCIISDFCLYYTRNIATKFRIPRISFHGFCCFRLLCQHNVFSSNVLDTITSDSEYFVVPNMPDDSKVEFNKLEFAGNRQDEFLKEIFYAILEADLASYGVVINTFEELESLYVKEYRKVRNDKAWCIGPVSLSHNDEVDKARRGNNKAAINEHQCLEWLDSQETSSVIYACLGSVSTLTLPQLKELGLGLEASNKPFVWVIRGNGTSKQVEKWIEEDGFEERTKGRGLVILGWAPQVLILSHPAVGGFLTHCGWNSTIEGISAGLPLITWPHFGDQFTNEKLAVENHASEMSSLNFYRKLLESAERRSCKLKYLDNQIELNEKRRAALQALQRNQEQQLQQQEETEELEKGEVSRENKHFVSCFAYCSLLIVFLFWRLVLLFTITILRKLCYRLLKKKDY